jgi:hypothetical protein
MKNLTIRILSFKTLMGLVVMIVAFLAFTVTTHAAAPAQPGIGNIPPAGQSNIAQTTGKLAHYSPKTLSCTRVAGTCSITIKNTTKVSQSVTSGGTTLFTLAPGKSQSIPYTTAGTNVYSLLSNTKATLTVTVT